MSTPSAGPKQPPTKIIPSVKRAGRDVKPSLSSTKVKNEWSCAPALPLRLHAVDRDEFTFSLYQLCCSVYADDVMYWVEHTDYKEKHRSFVNR